MYLRDALDRRSDPVEQAVALGAHIGPAMPQRRAAEALDGPAEIDRLLRRLACRRTGGGDVVAAFAAPDLQRLRMVLRQAVAAQGRVLPRRRG